MLMANFDSNQDGYITYNEFCDALYDVPSVQESSNLAEAKEEAHRARTPMMRDYKKKLLEAQRRETEEHDLRLCVKAFTANFFSRKVTLRKHFLNFDLDQSGEISRDEFAEALTRTNNDFSQQWKKILLHYFFPEPDHMLKYDEFMDMMF